MLASEKIIQSACGVVSVLSPLMIYLTIKTIYGQLCNSALAASVEAVSKVAASVPLRLVSLSIKACWLGKAETFVTTSIFSVTKIDE